MTTFWIITGALAVAVSVLLGIALLRGRRSMAAAGEFDLRVYRDQLKEIERDLARGVISPEDGERLRTEVSRRILAADTAAAEVSAAPDQPKPLGWAMVLLMASTVIGGGYGIYAQLGAPGYGDLGLESRKLAAAEARENRPSQSAAEAQVPQQTDPNTPTDYLELVAKLRGAVAERPDELQGYVLLARSEAALGNYVNAYKAQEQILRLRGDSATARDYADLADMMILAAGGYVSPQAEVALEAALARDPSNGVARYYGGLMWAQSGRPDAAFRVWSELLSESAAEDPWVPPITSQLEDMAYRAGVSNFTMPELATGALPGPSREDMEAAGEMSAEDRRDMIAGMVAQLSDRLATQGGTPEEWARLITAHGVLGNATQAIAVWENAQEVFGANSDALDIVREGARNAGIAAP